MRNLNKSGIYKITNLLTDDFYIGSSKNVSKRWNQHCFRSRNNSRRPTYFHTMLKEYGVRNFSVEIIEECDSDVSVLRDREQYYINYLKPLYNTLKDAISCIYKHTEDDIAKIKAGVAEARERISKERGNYLTPEGKETHKEKCSNISQERRDRYARETVAALKVAKKRQKDLADAFAKKYLRLIERMQKEGFNLSQIAAKLTAEGHTSRRGGIWTDQTVRQILKRTNRHVAAKDNSAAEKTRKQKADAFAERFHDIIQDMKESGMNLSEIAERLNADGHKSRRGATWTYQNVGQIMKRQAQAEKPPQVSMKARDLSSEILGNKITQVVRQDVKIDTGKRFIGWDRKN